MEDLKERVREWVRTYQVELVWTGIILYALYAFYCIVGASLQV